MSASDTALPMAWPSRRYTPRYAAWPYTPSDFARADESPDALFYAAPRFVTHIDSSAIARLSAYYGTTLPRSGTLLDFCSSWTSHYPPEVVAAARGGSGSSTSTSTSRGTLRVLGAGLNAAELRRNELLTGDSARIVQDLNEDPDLEPALRAAVEGMEGAAERGLLDAATCVVSIDYLARPLEVLSSVRRCMSAGASVHLAVSNRAFWDKVVRRWMAVGEDERLLMVADYLHFAGFEDVEIVDLCAPDEQPKGWMAMFGSMESDPLWVVRGKNPGGSKVNDE